MSCRTCDFVLTTCSPGGLQWPICFSHLPCSSRPPSLGLRDSLGLECTLHPDQPSVQLHQEGAWPAGVTEEVPCVLLVCCDNHHSHIVSLSLTSWGEGVFCHLCGLAHSGCSTHLKPFAFTYLLHQKWKLCRNCIDLSRFSRITQLLKIFVP